MVQPPEQHAPVSFLNTTGSGIATVVGCSCGVKPRRASQTASSRQNSHMAHRRKLGLPRADYSATVYGPEYPAAGLTSEQWRAVSPDADPYGRPPL